MTRRQNAPLRPLTPEEQCAVERVSRAQSAPVAQVVRAKLILTVTTIIP